MRKNKFAVSYVLQIDETYYARSHDDHTYNTSWIHAIGVETFTFWVQACNDAHLSLATIPGQPDTLAYEVVIGK